MSCSKIAVLGAGPKAIAIAAKAKVLSLLGFMVPKIAIYEKKGVANHWMSGSGFTNGELLLGTPPEKDVGFPYYSFCWGDEANPLVNHLMKSFSWQSFLISEYRFAEWIDRGHLAPSHSRWAEYLKWVFSYIIHDTEYINEEVIELDIINNQWVINSIDSHGISNKRISDSLVFTGPGKTKLPFSVPVHPHVLKVEDFWLSHSDFISMRNKSVAVIGAGETAACLALTLGKTHSSNRIDIISPQAMNYTRGESYVENHIYTDPFQGNWHLFTYADRANFIARTDQGVFSVETKKELDCLANIKIIPGECKSINIDSLQQIILDVHYNKNDELRIYELVVIATGFDHVAYLNNLLSPSAKAQILQKKAIDVFSKESLADTISETLAIENFEPCLHLPMLAGLRQGPGFPNLSSLGRLSDHILSHYVSIFDRKSMDKAGIANLLLKNSGP